MKKDAKNSLRIIGGKWRSRKLSFASIDGLRPTPNRIKETLFNWLMQEMEGAQCLDAFSGSGSLGFEALSRGAKKVIFVEQSRNACDCISENLNHLHCDQGTVIHADLLSWLKTAKPQPLDIIFLDPPFKKGLIAPTFNLLMQYQWILPKTLIYTEIESDLQLDIPTPWTIHKEKKAGQVLSRIYKKKN